MKHLNKHQPIYHFALLLTLPSRVPSVCFDLRGSGVQVLLHLNATSSVKSVQAKPKAKAQRSLAGIVKVVEWWGLGGSASFLFDSGCLV